MKIIFNVIIYLILTSSIQNQYNYLNINKYRVVGYYYSIIDNDFVIKIEDLTNEKSINRFYLFTKDKFNEVNSKILNDRYKQVFWNDEYEKFIDKFKHIDYIKNRSVCFVEYQKDKYYITLADPANPYKEDLYYFDGKKKYKIILNKIYPQIESNASFMFYDKETGNLYFPGYKMDKIELTGYNFGLYIYNINTKKTMLFHKAHEESHLSCPYKIPNTNKIIIFESFLDHDEIIIKERKN